MKKDEIMKKIILVENNDQFDKHLEIRKEVFCVEQKIDVKIEIDKYDETLDSCDHFLIYLGDSAVGTLRCIKLNDKEIKMGRFCVLEKFRRFGLGSFAIEFVKGYYAKQGFEIILVGAQFRAYEFYKKCGFVPIGDEFIEAGIPHTLMQLDLR